MNSYEFLENNLERHRDLLKFAEAKNATLVLASIGVVVVLVQQISNASLPDTRFWFFVPLAFFVLSALLCAWSFTPQKRDEALKPSTVRGDKNLLYYGDTKNLSVYQFSELMKKKGGYTKPTTQLEYDYIDQTINNAKITHRKMEYFKWALRLFLGGIIVPVIGSILSFLLC